MPKCVGEGLIMELELKFMVEKSFEPRLRALGYKAGKFCRQLDTYYIVDETVSVPGCAFAKIRSTKALR